MVRPLYIVSHIPKTAGSTLRCNFELNFTGSAWLPADVPGTLEWDEVTGQKSPEELKAYIDGLLQRNFSSQTGCIFGHWAYHGIHEAIPTQWKGQLEARYLAFLREPIARVISMYRYNARTARTSSHQEIQENDWSLGEWFERSSNPRRRNGQVRHLLLGSHPDIMTRPELSREHLEIAKTRLKDFWFVGLTETFDEDSAYLYGRLQFKKFLPIESVNVSEGRFEADTAATEEVAKGNELDIELYEFARDLRESIVANASDKVAVTRSYQRARGLSDLRAKTIGRARRLLSGGTKGLKTVPSGS